MVSAVSERVELAKLCCSRDWSKAIRVLDSLLQQSCAIQDLCNRAFCYSQLELHKHVIKDCDKALQLDPSLLQAYILKGRAISALGRKEEALLVWELGYMHALQQSTDLRQLLELEDLLKASKQGKQEKSLDFEKERTDSGLPSCLPELRVYSNGKSSEVGDIDSKGGSTLSNGVSRQLKTESLTSLSKLVPDTNGETGKGYENDNESHRESKSSIESTNGSKIQSDQSNNFEAQSRLNDKATMKNIPHNKVNAKIDGEPSSSYASDKSTQLPMISSNGSDRIEICGKSANKFRLRDEISEEAKWNKKFSVTRISKTKSISVDFRLSRGIAQVNEGNYAYAISIFDQMLREDPTYPEALIGRGTAYAFQRELEAAIADFTKAIESNPAAGEAWKRRGQARAALGEFSEAVKDLTKALEFEPDSADILHERGIVNFKFKDLNAAVEDLSACVKLDQDNKSAFTYLGLALSAIGEYGKAAEAHLKSIQLDKKFLEAWAHLTQFYQDLAIPEKALECLQQVMEIDGRYVKAYHLRGLLYHGMGEHRKAIKYLTVGLSIDSVNIECLYLRASCFHAVGEYGEAVKDYDAALDVELDSMDKFVLQCLAFYQKEIALYTAFKVNSDFCWFDIDGDIDPLFKEYWCKRLHPKNVCEKVYRQPPLRDSLKKGKLRKQDFAITKQKTALLLAADSIGKKIQYQCPGFLPNRRQHRMAGLAAIEIAQKVSKAWRTLRMDQKNSSRGSKNGKRNRRRERMSMASQNRGGACCSTSSSSETSTSYGVTEDRSSGRSVMSWQDVYQLAVKWRQISEPCDPVVWVNKLSEEFNSGFGSHTPIVLGQSKVVRYFPNHERTLGIAKTIMKERLFVINKADKIIDLSDHRKSEEISDVKSCDDLYKIVGEDFWLGTWCNSAAFEGKQLEGTRITLVKMGDLGYDFAIRTPCTPSRWDDFDTEMSMAWEALCNAYCGETYGSTDFDMLENVRDTILRMTYYWYNFMPLSRGTAVVGFVVLLGLLLAANMEFTGNIPKDLQVDWEAILTFDPNSFVDSIKSWLYPSLKVTASWKGYPDVSSTFQTTGSVVAALSSCDD